MAGLPAEAEPSKKPALTVDLRIKRNLAPAPSSELRGASAFPLRLLVWIPPAKLQSPLLVSLHPMAAPSCPGGPGPAPGEGEVGLMESALCKEEKNLGYRCENFVYKSPQLQPLGLPRHSVEIKGTGTRTWLGVRVAAQILDS